MDTVRGQRALDGYLEGEAGYQRGTVVCSKGASVSSKGEARYEPVPCRSLEWPRGRRLVADWTSCCEGGGEEARVRDVASHCGMLAGMRAIAFAPLAAALVVALGGCPSRSNDSAPSSGSKS